MRDPFPYESDTQLLRTCLVPDPLPLPAWTEALEEWRSGTSGISLAEHLICSGRIGETELMATLGAALGVRVYPKPPSEAGRKESPVAQLARRHGFLPLRDDGLDYLAGGPEAAPDLKKYLGPDAGKWEWVLISPLREATAEIHHPGRISSDRTGPANDLKAMLLNVRARGAADLYLELVNDRLDIRMRTSGGLQQVAVLAGDQSFALVRLLRQMADFSTAENALPQDGRIRVPLDGGDLVFRISQIPTVDGASIVLRQLGSGERVLPLRKLGVPDPLRTELLHAVRFDTGLILVTGSTGSGKTTTLYGLLKDISPLPLKIMTIEDPVEYELPRTVQSNVDERNGWTFDRAIQAFLRQDPDVILVGEIRDAESATAACRAALTGHVVLASLHASGPGMALARLRAWDIPEGVLQDTVRMVVHQRLRADESGGRLRADFQWTRPFANSVEATVQQL